MLSEQNTLTELASELGVNKSLSNFLVDEYLHVLERRSLFMGQIKDQWYITRPSTPTVAPEIAVIPSWMSSIVFKHNGEFDESSECPRWSLNCQHADYILIPALLMIPSPHEAFWALVVVDVHAQQILWHDWTAAKEINDYGFITIVVQQWLHRELLQHGQLEIATWPIVKAVEGRSAIDCGAGECGVMMLLTATYIAEGRPLTQVTTDHARWFRLTIAATVFNGFK